MAGHCARLLGGLLLVDCSGPSTGFQQAIALFATEQTRAQSQNRIGFFQLQDRPPSAREILHPKIAEPVWHAFLRGEFDVAAFQAMKAVEVSVREAAALTDGDIGVKLMRKAFGTENGPLMDPTTEDGERRGRMDLFAGA